MQGKKKRDAETADRVKALEAAKAEQASAAIEEETEGGGDLLSSKDEDVIF